MHARLPFDFQVSAGGGEYVVVVPTKVLTELDDKQHEGRFDGDHVEASGATSRVSLPSPHPSSRILRPFRLKKR